MGATTSSVRRHLWNSGCDTTWVPTDYYKPLDVLVLDPDTDELQKVMNATEFVTKATNTKVDLSCFTVLDRLDSFGFDQKDRGNGRGDLKFNAQFRVSGVGDEEDLSPTECEFCFGADGHAAVQQLYLDMCVPTQIQRRCGPEKLLTQKLNKCCLPAGKKCSEALFVVVKSYNVDHLSVSVYGEQYQLRKNPANRFSTLVVEVVQMVLIDRQERLYGFPPMFLASAIRMQSLCEMLRMASADDDTDDGNFLLLP